MFLHNLGEGLLRRWYFVLAGLLLTGMAAGYTWTAVPPMYRATATSVLVPPSSLVGENGNPYLYMSGLDQALTVLTVRLNSAEVVDPLLQSHRDASLTVEKDVTTPGPIMRVTATDSSREGVMQLLQDAARIVPANLSVMQDQLRIPAFSRVTAMTVVQDDVPALMTKDRLRVILGVIALGLAVTVLGTAVADRMMTRRRNRRGRRTGQTAAQGGDEEVELPAILPQSTSIGISNPSLRSEP